MRTSAVVYSSASLMSAGERCAPLPIVATTPAPASYEFMAVELTTVSAAMNPHAFPRHLQKTTFG